MAYYLGYIHTVVLFKAFQGAFKFFASWICILLPYLASGHKIPQVTLTQEKFMASRGF